jgi:hypothetical protein
MSGTRGPSRGPVGRDARPHRAAPSPARAYHQPVLLPAPWFLALALVAGLLVLLPARRLQLAGMSGRTIGTYALFVWLLGLAVIARPGVTRFLIPILLIAYIAPFVASPERIERITRRRGRGDPPRPPIKDVTPPSERIDGP